ncbi:MAG: GntR family transcriptional regulator [Polyangiaceae bacterium]|nr:GntR family transcriptional regulator [Polyangiaceae bacterium]
MLNPASPLPLYQQLAHLLGERIATGHYEPGTRIPSEPDLARTYRIGRPTVRQATELLVRRGQLERRRGSGTFVTERPREVDLFSLGGTIAAFRSQGIEPRAHWLEHPALSAVAADVDHPFAGRSVYRLSRLSSIEDRPALLETMFLDPEVFPKLERIELEGRSLSEIVRDEYALVPSSGRQVFRIVRLGPQDARTLAVQEGEPALLVRRTLDFPRAHGAVYAELCCLTDQVVYSQTLGVSTP